MQSCQSSCALCWFEILEIVYVKFGSVLYVIQDFRRMFVFDLNLQGFFFFFFLSISSLSRKSPTFIFDRMHVAGVCNNFVTLVLLPCL